MFISRASLTGWLWIVAGGIIVYHWLPWARSNVIHLQLVHEPQRFAVQFPAEGASPMVLRWAAHGQLQQGTPDAAERLLQAAAHGSQAGLAYFDLCVLAWANGQEQQALAACQEGKIPSQYWYKRAAEADMEGDLLLAERDYHFALVLQPDWLEAATRLASIYDRLGQHEKILTLLETWLQAGSPPLSVYQLMGYAYWKEGQLAVARSTLEAGASAFPEDSLLQLYLGYVYQDSGEMVLAASSYDQYLGRATGSEYVWLQRARVAEALQDWQKALEIYQRIVLGQDDASLDAWLGYGRASQALQMLEQARLAYQHVLELDPGNAFARQELEKIK